MWLYGKERLKVIHHPAKFGGDKHYDSGDIFLICHMISRDHKFQESCDLVGRSLLR